MTQNNKIEPLGMLLGRLGANLLGNMLAGKGVIATSQGQGVILAGKGKNREGQDF